MDARTIRSPAFQRPMARLALVAMLLLATLPTFGRLLASRAHDDAQAWSAMCTAGGLRQLLPGGTGPSSAMASHGAGVPVPAGHAHPDCAYCPLLAGLALAVAGLALALARAPASRLCTWNPVPARKSPHPCGLGSRGPPPAPWNR